MKILLWASALLMLSCNKGSDQPENVPVTRSYQCTSDNDCVVSCARPEDCCGIGCGCNAVYHQEEHLAIVAANREKCSEQPAQCAVFSCAKPTYTTEAHCENNTCVGVQVPIQSEQTAD